MIFIKLTRNGIITLAILIVTILIILVAIIVSNLNVEKTSDASIHKATLDISGTVCIDAGHGGSDSGAISTDGTISEKDDNLTLALKVQEYLENMGITVIMTRIDDTYLDLNERCRIANTDDVDLFVSLHRNSAEDTSARGVEVWVHSSAPPVDVRLAENVLDNLMQIPNQQNRGIEYGYRGDSTEDYRINRLTTMPSCLVETGFISNIDDVNLFQSNFDDFAMAITMGIYQTLEDITTESVDTSRGKAGQNWN